MDWNRLLRGLSGGAQGAAQGFGQLQEQQNWEQEQQRLQDALAVQQRLADEQTRMNEFNRVKTNREWANTIGNQSRDYALAEQEAMVNRYLTEQQANRQERELDLRGEELDVRRDYNDMMRGFSSGGGGAGTDPMALPDGATMEDMNNVLLFGQKLADMGLKVNTLGELWGLYNKVSTQNVEGSLSQVGVDAWTNPGPVAPVQPSPVEQRRNIMQQTDPLYKFFVKDPRERIKNSGQSFPNPNIKF